MPKRRRKNPKPKFYITCYNIVRNRREYFRKGETFTKIEAKQIIKEEKTKQTNRSFKAGFNLKTRKKFRIHESNKSI